MRSAAALAFVLLTVGCGSVPTASGASSSPSAAGGHGWLDQQPAQPTGLTSSPALPGTFPTPSPSPSPTPAPTATPSPAGTPAPSCYPVKGGTASRATITDVRVGRHPGFDRVVVQFNGGLPYYQLAAQDPATFVSPGSGAPIPVVGSAAVHLTLTNIDLPPVYAHGTNQAPGYIELRNVVVLGVFEGQADVAIGLAALRCPLVSVLGHPTRLVIDFPSA